MRSLNSLVWRNLIANPLRSILTALAITLGVGMVLAAAIVGQAASQSATQLSEQGSQVDLEIFARDNSPFDQTILDMLRAQTDVEHASPSLRVEVNTVDPIIGKLTLLGIEPESYQAIHQPELAGGTFLDQPDTVVLPVVIAIKHGLRVGDKITVQIGDKSATLTVAGRLKLKQDITALAETTTAFVPLAVAQHLAGVSGRIDRVAVSVPAGVDVEQAKTTLVRQLGDNLAVAQSTIGGGVQFNTVILQIGLLAVGIIILFAGGFVIMNAFLMTVAQRTRQIGMIRALGLTQGQVMRLVLLEAGVLGLLGSGLGLVTGLALAWGVMAALSTLDETLFVAPWWGIVLSLLLGLGVTLAAALQPAWQASRISPLVAVRQSRANTGHSWYLRQGSRVGVALMGLLLIVLVAVGLLLRPNMWEAMAFVGISLVVLLTAMALMLPALIDLTGRLARPVLLGRLGTPGRLAADSLSRNRLRSALTAGALTAALATIIITSGFLSILLEGGMRTSIDLLHEDYIVAPNLMDQLAAGELSIQNLNYETVWGTPLDPALLADLEALAATGQLQVEYMTSAPIQPELAPTIGFPAIFVDPEIFLGLGNFDFFEGDPASALALMRRGRAVMLQPIVAERFNAHVGDTILVQTPGGEIEVTIAGIGGTTWMATIFPYRDGQEYFNITSPTVLGLVIPEDQDREAVLARIDTIISRYSDWMLLEANENGLEPILNVINVFKRLLNALLFLAVIVAALGVINTMAINVTERQREIGLLRAVGATQRQIRRAIVLEGGLLGLMATLTATGLGLIFLLTLTIVALPNSSVSLGLRPDLEKVLMTLSLGLRDMGLAAALSLIFGPLIAALAAYYPAKQAAAMDVVEATRSERVTLTKTTSSRRESDPAPQMARSFTWTLAWRTLTQYRSRTFLSVLAITLGVTTIIATGVIGQAIVSVLSESEDVQVSMRGVFDQFDTMLAIVGIAIAGTAAFLIFNTFAMSVAQRRQHIGALRTLGTTRRQIAQLILAEALIISVIGSLMGLLAGPLVARGILTVMKSVATVFSAFGDTTPSILSMVWAVGLGIGTTILATLIPALQAARVSPLVALRQTTVSGAESVSIKWAVGALLVMPLLLLYLMVAPPGEWLPPPQSYQMAIVLALVWVVCLTLLLPVVVDRLAGGLRKPLTRLLGATGRLVVDNLQRTRRRVTLTIATLAIGLGLVVSLSGFMTFWMDELFTRSLNQVSYSGAWGIFTVDILAGTKVLADIDTLQMSDETVADMRATVAGQADLIESYMVTIPEFSFLGDSYFSMVMDPHAIKKSGTKMFSFSKGNWETALPIMEAGCGVLTTPGVASLNEVGLGDALTVQGQNGPVECVIAGIGAPFVGATLISSAAGDDFRSSNPMATLLLAHADADLDKLERDLLDLQARHTDFHIIEMTEYKATVQYFMRTIRTLLGSMLVLAVVMAAMGVVNTTVISVAERRREFGLLRGVGATRQQIKMVVMGEAALMGVVGGFLGFVAGVGITLILVLVLGGQVMGIELDVLAAVWRSTQPALLNGLLGLIAAPLISAGAAWWPVRAILRGPAVETLQPERPPAISPRRVVARIWHWGSIRTRFVVGTGVLLLVVLTGLVEVITRHEQSNLEDLLHDTLTTLVEGQAGLIELNLPAEAQTLGLTDFQVAPFNPEDLLRFKMLVDDMSARGLESFSVVDQDNIVLLSLNPSEIGSSVPALESSNEALVTLKQDGDEWRMPATTPIRNDAGQIIGSVRLTLNLAEVRAFLRRTRNTLWAAGSGVIVVGLILSWLLATPLVVATRQLADHAALIAQGEYKSFDQTRQRYWLPAFVRRTSLRTRLTIVMVLIVILLVGVLETLVIPLERRHIESTVQDNMLSAATWMGQAVSESLTTESSPDTIETGLPALEQMLESGQTLDWAKLQALTQQAQTGDIAYAALVDAKGTIQLSDQLALIGEAVPVFAETHIEEDHWRDEAIWAVSTPIRYGQDGEQLGVLRLGVRRVRIETFLTESRSLFRLTGLIAILAGVLLTQAIGGAVTAPMRELTAGTRRIAAGDFEVQFPVNTNDELALLAASFNQMVAGLREREWLRDMFGRFVSHEVAEALRTGQVRLEGENRVVSILFCDIRGFTARSEQCTPAEMVALLNEYLPVVVGAAQKYEGTVNKFGGDSTLVIYGAPKKLQESAYQAVLTALEMRLNLQTLNKTLIERSEAPIRIGVGINTGMVLAGAVGPKERQEYTVIGDTVNLASRIEALNKEYPHYDILISGWTYEALGNRQTEFDCVDLGQIQIRGKVEPVQVWAVVGLNR